MPDRPTDIMIFGAGFGTRMAPLSDELPKPLIPVAGKPLIDHAIQLATQADLTVHVNAHYRADQLQAHLPPFVTCHIERPDILDTGGGLKSALPRMSGEAVMTLNSDAIWRGPNPCALLRDAWHPTMRALLLLVPSAQTLGHGPAGDFSINQGHITRDQKGMVYTGAQIIKADCVAQHHETAFSMNKVWDTLIAQKRAYGMIYPGRWADVGTPQAIPLAEAMLRDV